MPLLVVEAAAEAELAAALDWYEEQEPGLGAALLHEVDGVIDGLLAQELRGVGVPGVRNDLAVRRIILDRFPYAVVFIEHSEAIHVIAVAHHKRRPGYWRDRL